MSNSSKELGRKAKEDLETAREAAKRASKTFKVINDPDAKKLADAASDAADKGVKYVQKRLG